ncbi:MAG: histidine triad nucleotide-binding protein [Gammaproteobacteria bacterium]|nr:MAG: histidine triad nucleotide-binding protein [Gammaproteobacteria bacterium]
MANDCLFCRIVAGEIPSERVYEDEQVVAFKDIHPKAPVHILVVPRLHIPSLFEVRPEHDGLMAHLCRTLPEIARQLGLERGFRVIINNGPEGGQEILHLHVHLLGGRRLPGF